MQTTTEKQTQTQQFWKMSKFSLELTVSQTKVVNFPTLSVQQLWRKSYRCATVWPCLNICKFHCKHTNLCMQSKVRMHLFHTHKYTDDSAISLRIVRYAIFLHFLLRRPSKVSSDTAWNFTALIRAWLRVIAL